MELLDLSRALFIVPAEALLHPPPRLRALADTLHAWWCQPAPGTHRGGWDTITTDGYTSTGRWFPPDAVGHLGYTGTSLWMSPSRDAIVVLLTNRIHPRDTLEGIRAFRPRFHDAVAAALGWAPHGEPRA